METAKSLFKGKAIKEHMEDAYCEMVAVSLLSSGSCMKSVAHCVEVQMPGYAWWRNAASCAT